MDETDEVSIWCVDAKGGFFSESAIRFLDLEKKNIAKNYLELEIQNSRPQNNTVMGGNFKFQVKNSFFGSFFWEIWKTNRTFWKKATFKKKEFKNFLFLDATNWLVSEWES